MHIASYKTHVRGGFLIIFQVRLCHQLMDSSCLLFAIGVFPAPTHSCPFSYPAALSVRYSAVTKHFCSHWYTQFKFLNSSYKLVCESKHCALRTQVTIIIHNFNKMVPGRSSEQRVKYIPLICKQKKNSCCFPNIVMIVSPYVTDDKSLTLVHSGIFSPK